MKIQKKSAEVKTVNGNPLPQPIGFNYEFPELEKGDVIPQDEYPDEDDIRQYVNTKRNSAARAKAQNEALTAAGISVSQSLENPDFRLKQMIKLLVANGQEPAAAEAFAKQALGL